LVQGKAMDEMLDFTVDEKDIKKAFDNSKRE